MSSLRESNKSLKRKRILESAAAHFSRFGFEEATLRDIARDAGVGLGTVLLYAESKHALLHEVWRETTSGLLSRAIDDAEGRPVVEGALCLFEPFLRAYHREPELARVIIKELPWLTGKTLEEHRPELESLLGALCKLVAKAIERGSYRATTSPSQVAHIFFALYYGACIELCSPLGDLNLERALIHLRGNLSLVESGLGGAS